ncbi:Radical SAM superfamily protein [Planctomycetes bacterium Poly30]|uniref:Radical SAM superfamily protein n=1 Tax=Saltatorellus ferox TaxID=2528018 RepID=A0A518EXN5_9BACT|nr:Radical SAM superfamily protein [Planctomycetes bacterium Poly30]
MRLENGQASLGSAHRIGLQRAADVAGPGGRRTAPLPPIGLLVAATALREHEGLRRGAPPRLQLTDAAITPSGKDAGSRDEATERTLAFEPEAVLLASEPIELPERGGSRQPADGPAPWLDRMVDAGHRLGKGPSGAPFRILWIDETQDAARVLLEEGAADLVVRGEADEFMPSLVEAAIAGRTDWSGQRGVSWHDGTAVRHERMGATTLKLATPAWDLIDLSRYSGTNEASWLSGTRLETWGHQLLRHLPTRVQEGVQERLRVPRSSGSREATIFTSRTCPPDCPTCHGSFGSHGRERSVAEIVQEVRELVQKHRVRHIAIGDPAFDGQPARAEAIVNAIAKLRSAPGYGRLTVSFPRGLRGDGLTPGLIDALLRAGATTLPLRVTTASPRLQRLLKENIDLQKVDKALGHMADRGVRGHLMLRLGLPTETVGEAAHTIRWARASQAATADFESGRQVDLGPAWTRDQSGDIDDFPSLRRRALTSFYSSPARAGRLAKSVPASLAHAIQRRI